MNKAVIQQLLALKSKATCGERWEATDYDFVGERLKEDESSRILAASCIISSGQSRHFPYALEVIRNAVKLRKFPPYIVLSICEALVFVEAKDFLPFSKDIMAFVTSAIKQRAINLDNALCLLGKLSMAGDQEASELLATLVCDADPDIRQTAAQIMAAHSNSGNSHGKD